VAHEAVRAPVLSLSTTRDDGAEFARSCHYTYGEVLSISTIRRQNGNERGVSGDDLYPEKVVVMNSMDV
jgi:hypothetical protein